MIRMIGARDNDELELFPRPRRLVVSGDGASTAQPARTLIDERLGAESFVLEVDADAVLLRAGDEAGRGYGLALLEQIRAQCGERLPGLLVEDSPDFNLRGYLLDISRDRVPTRATLERLVTLMAVARLNHLELYMEHTFAYRDHEEVWRQASPITPADLAWLDDLCRGHGIELVPNQNCFGHMGRWLQHERYRWRAESPAGIELLPGITFPPSTLAPTADNAAFALDLLRELLPNFSARRVNIGCDEPFELGRGVSGADVAARGRVAVYTDHVRRIAEPLIDDGYDVLLWADILRHDAKIARQLPTGIVPIAWTYEAPRSDGSPVVLPDAIAAVLAAIDMDPNVFSGFESNVAPMTKAGVPFWVAPGTSSWCSLIGRIDNARANLIDAATIGRANRSPGFLITDWGDEGHLQPPSVSFGPMLFGGAVAWCTENNADLDLAAVLDRHAFLDPTHKLGAAVVDLGSLWTETGLSQLNGSPLHSAVAEGSMAFATGEPDPVRLRGLLDRLEADLAAIEHASPESIDGAQVVDELLVAGRLARHGAWRLLAQTEGKVEVDLRKDLAVLVEQQRNAWLARARPGGLPESIATLERTLAAYG